MVKPIKLVYDPDQPDDQLNLTASAFTHLAQYASSSDHVHRAYCCAKVVDLTLGEYGINMVVNTKIFRPIPNVPLCYISAHC